MKTFQDFLQGVDLDIGTSGRFYCHYLTFRQPIKVLRAYGLRSGHKVRVTLDRSVGQRHPFVFADLARDENKARETGLRISGITEIDKIPWETWITKQKGEQRQKLFTDLNGRRRRRPVTGDNDEMISKLNTMLDEVDGCQISEIECKARRFLLQNITKGRPKATVT